MTLARLSDMSPVASGSEGREHGPGDRHRNHPGATELFPVSSLGHAVVLPALLHWRSTSDRRSSAVSGHAASRDRDRVAALFLARLVGARVGVLGLAATHQVRESRRVFLLIVVATIPAVIVGFVLEKFVRGLFGSPVIAAAFLVVNGLLLFGERLRGAAVTVSSRP